MVSFNEQMDEYRKLVAKGTLREAYKGLMGYIRGLRAHFNKSYPGWAPPGSIYLGYMDMTYFPLFPKPLEEKRLKVAIVFLHETCSFEAWLAASNKKAQSYYWTLLRERGWKKYRMPSSTDGADSITECVLVKDPDFNDLDALTLEIESGALRFIADISRFLAEADR